MLPIQVHVFIRSPADAEKLAEISAKLDQLLKQERQIKMTLDETLSKVREETTVEQSLVTLTGDIKKRLDDLLAGNLTPDQQAKVDEIFNEVEANRAAAAIVANTPPPPPTP